jgi:hypothetical protein
MPPGRAALDRVAFSRSSLQTDHVHVKDRVCLREDYLDLPRGAVGVVIGFYRREETTCAVSFERGVREVPVNLLEPLGDQE